MNVYKVFQKKYNNLRLIPFHLPTNPKYICFNLDIKNIKIKNSITNPIIIPCNCYFNNNNDLNNSKKLSNDIILDDSKGLE